MGLLDPILGNSLDDPKTMGAMALAQGLLSDPRPMRGLATGMQDRAQAIAQAKAQKQHEEAAAIQMQMQQMQLQGMQQQMARQTAIRDELARAEAGGMLTTPATGASPMRAQPAAFTPAYNALRANLDPSSQPAGTSASGGNLTEGLTQRLVQQAGIYAKNGDFDNANKLYEQAAKFIPEVKEISVSMQNGKPVNVITYKNGKQEVSGFAPTPKVHWLDSGGAITPINEQDMSPLTAGVSKTAGPGERVTMRGQNMTDARARELNAITREGQQTQVVSDPERGTMLVNKGTGVMRPALGSDGKQVMPESSVKRQNSAVRVLPLLNEADKLIDQATGSYIGAGVDFAGRAFGAATDGNKAIARLKVIEGNLMLSQPRMEGPQSDKDTMLYRQMAGQIGDPTVPAAIKKSALETIRSIQEKYAGGKSGAGPMPSTQGIKFLGYEE